MYSRISNPTLAAVEEKLADLEGGAGAMLVSSGQSANLLAVFNICSAGLPIRVPENYFPGDDDTLPPVDRWRGHANLLFSNWLNYIVYQTVPYNVMAVGRGERTE